MPALPPRPNDHIFNDATVRGAYDKLKRREESLLKEPNSKQRSQSLINVRLLGYIMLEWPGQEAIRTVATTVAAFDEVELELAGQKYFDHLLRVFRSNKGPTPNPSGHVSRPSFDRKVDMVKDVLQEASQDHRAAKDKALIRDGFRCVVTAAYDSHTVKKIKELEDEVRASNSLVEATQCAHVFGESTNANISRPVLDEKKKNYAATVWTIMDSFGYRRLREDLNGINIHRLENVMTMSTGVHDKFDRLELWFLETDTPNMYKLDSRESYYLNTYPKTVTFKDHSGLGLPLPSPTYLRIHASCGRIAHLSGAADYIDMVLREMEDIKVLSEDGTSAELLNHAILSSNPHVSAF